MGLARRTKELYLKYFKIYKNSPEKFGRILRRGKRVRVKLHSLWELYRKDRKLSLYLGELLSLFKVWDNSRTVSARPVEKMVVCSLPTDCVQLLLEIKAWMQSSVTTAEKKVA